MTSLFRNVFLVAALCAALFSVPAAVLAAETPKTDKSGWILPGSNVGDDWYLRLADARSEAAKDEKPILIVFSGPDWSSNCKKFESSVLKSKDFTSSVRSAVVGLYIQHFVNTAAPEEQVDANASLRKALAVPPVYPCTVILASDGKKILGIIQGAPEKSAYIRQVARFAGIKLAE